MRTNALSVLVADDCRDTAESCADLLRLYGHDARPAEGGREALALLGVWEPDVALIDLCMPVISGFDIARWLRARGAAGPLLIAVTGMSAKPYRERAAAGFDHYWVKPVGAAVMTGLLRIHAANLSAGKRG